MWAFIPASANWIGWVCGFARASKRGAQAGVTCSPALSAAYAVKNRLAKWTSSRARNSPARNAWPATALLTSSVTWEYIRLKVATPSCSGSSDLDRRHPLEHVVDALGSRPFEGRLGHRRLPS